MIIICASVLNPAAVFSTDVSCTLLDFPFGESKCKQEASLFKAFLLGFYCKCRFCFSQQHRVISPSKGKTSGTFQYLRL